MARVAVRQTATRRAGALRILLPANCSAFRPLPRARNQPIYRTVASGRARETAQLPTSEDESIAAPPLARRAIPQAIPNTLQRSPREVTSSRAFLWLCFCSPTRIYFPFARSMQGEAETSQLNSGQEERRACQRRTSRMIRPGGNRAGAESAHCYPMTSRPQAKPPAQGSLASDMNLVMATSSTQQATSVPAQSHRINVLLVSHAVRAPLPSVLLSNTPPNLERRK